MLQKEFENLIGHQVTDDEYAQANAMYMECGDGIDKETFCELYKKNPLELCSLIACEATRLRDIIYKKDCQVSKLTDAIIELSEACYKDYPHACSEAEQTLTNTIGARKYMCSKLTANAHLTLQDKGLLITLIGK